MQKIRSITENRKFTIAAIILGVLAFSMLLALPQARKLGPLIALAVPAAVAAIFLIRNPVWGLALFIVVCMVVPFELGTGTQTGINAAIMVITALSGIWVVKWFVFKHEFPSLRSKAIYALVGLCSAASIGFLIGQLDWFPLMPKAPITAQVGGLALFFYSALAFVLVGQFVTKQIWLERLVWLFLSLGGIAVLSMTFTRLSPFRSIFNNGALGSVFWIWMTTLSLSQALFNRDLKPGVRLGLGLIAVLSSLGRLYVYRDWVSGWLPPISAGLVTILVGLPIIGIPALMGAAVISIIYGQRFLNRVYAANYTRGEEYSYLSRIDAWVIMWQIIKTNPITGFGPANYRFVTPTIPLRGFYLQFNSHNQYVDLVAQAGLLGLGFFLWFCLEIVLLAWKLIRTLPAGGFGRAYAVGALGGLAGMLVCGMLGDWVIPFVYNIGFQGFQASLFGWIFLGGLIVIQRTNSQLEDSKSTKS